MVEFLDRDRRSNSVLPSRFGQGIKPPRRPNFAQNMHPNKRCRRSLARPNRTTPEYHDVDHGVAVGRPWRFCFIAPIAPAHTPRSSSPLMPRNQLRHCCRHRRRDRGRRRRRLTHRMEEGAARSEEDDKDDGGRSNRDDARRRQRRRRAAPSGGRRRMGRGEHRS